MTARREGLGLLRTAELLRPYATGEGRPLALGALLSLAGVALHVVRPWPLKWIVDALTGHGGGSVVGMLTRDAGIGGFVALGGAYILLSAGFAASNYGQNLLLNGIGNRVLYRFRAVLFERVLAKPLSFHDAHEPGELLTRVVYDTSRLRRGVNGVLLHVFQTIVLFAVTLVVLLWVAPRLAAVVATGGVVAFLLMRRVARSIATATRRQRRKEGAVAAAAADDLMSVRDVQTFGRATSAALGRFGKRNTMSLAGEQRVRRLAAGLLAQIELVVAITVAITLAVGGHAVSTGSLSAGDLVLFISYALALREPFAQCARETARIGRTTGCAHRLSRIVAERAGSTAGSETLPLDAFAGALSLNQVDVLAQKRARSSRKWALQSVTLALPSGHRVAVTGSTGGGKSTLLRLVLGLVAPTHGHLCIDGVPIAELDMTALRMRMSVVLQDTVLFGLTVRENLGLGVASPDDAAMQAAAHAARIDHFIDRLPRGYDTPVRQRGALFSSGERQRLAIARALLRDGSVWLLDDPLAGLDVPTSRALADVLLERTAGRTTLWVTHDPDIMARMDWVLSLKGGRVAFSGTPEAHAYWTAQRTRAAVFAHSAFTQEH